MARSVLLASRLSQPIVALYRVSSLQLTANVAEVARRLRESEEAQAAASTLRAQAVEVGLHMHHRALSLHITAHCRCTASLDDVACGAERGRTMTSRVALSEGAR